MTSLHHRICLATCTFFALVTTGCSEPTKPEAKPAAVTNAAPPKTSSSYYGPLDHAQPKLPTVKLWLGAIELETEIASRPVEIMTGMMYREKMADTEGMIFVLPDGPRKASFYMRNTKVPLSCAYIDVEGRILEIHDLRPFDETPVESVTEQVAFVLEVPQGWFQRQKIEVGALIRSEMGSLVQTFYRRR